MFKSNKRDLPVNMFKDNDHDGVMNVFDCKPNNPRKQGFVDAVIGAASGLVRGTGVKAGWRTGMVKKGNPVSRKFEKVRTTKVYRAIPGLSELVNPRNAKGQVQTYGERVENMRRRVQEGNINPVMRRKIMMVKRAIRSAVPVIPAGATSATTQYQSKKGQMGGRGRPKGSLDPRYAAYGGVMGYRAYMRDKRKAFKEQMRMQEEQIKMQKQLSRMPQYETQQYQQTPQQPQEEVQQYQQVQQPQQMPQYQQEYAQEAPQQPIARVFKSYGGKPYPAVERQPLTPSKQTVPAGFVEVVDPFTSKRYLKQLPRPERWSAGGGQ